MRSGSADEKFIQRNSNIQKLVANDIQAISATWLFKLLPVENRVNQLWLTPMPVAGVMVVVTGHVERCACLGQHFH
jgi:hypothetical protein